MPGGGTFKVVWSGKLLGNWREAYAQCQAAGLGRQLLAATHQIETRLRTDAREAGEERYHLYRMKLLIRHIVVAPLSIHFGVHEERDIVVIQRVQLLELRHT